MITSWERYDLSENSYWRRQPMLNIQITGTEASKKLVWLQRLLSELCEDVFQSTPLHIDNRAADLLARITQQRSMCVITSSGSALGTFTHEVTCTRQG